MISKTMQDLINQQIKAEMYSSNLYLAMSAYCESTNLRGSAHWLREQAREEIMHAMKFYSYLNDRGGRVVIGAIEQPPVEFKSALDVFTQTLEHEVKVTGLINNLLEAANREKDPATANFLQWFIAEQVEEEATATGIVDTLKMIGDSANGQIMLDRELGKRGR